MAVASLASEASEMRSGKQIIIFGAGGHGKVLAETAMRSGLDVAGFVDDRPRMQVIPGLGIPILGDRAWLLDQPSDSFVCALGVGDNAGRMRIGEMLRASGFELAKLISRFASVSASARIAAGVVVLAGAVINPEAVLGEGSIVNSGAIVEHDVKIGRYAHLSPNSTLGGGVEVGDLAHVAIGATVLPCVRIGCRSILGAGSVATRSIPDDVVAYGAPARVKRLVREEAAAP